MKKYLLVFGLFISISLSAQLRINELMQSNIDCLMDELFDFPDSWVEIYNDSEEPININGWYIGEKKDYLKGWQIQKDTIILAKGYLVIFCDKVGEGIHTDFRLETTKESNLYLFNPAGNKVDEVKDIPAQPNPNIAYGCVSDGSFHFLIDATPGYTNNLLAASLITSAPKFEQRAGVYKTPIKVVITDTSNIPNAKIYYTIDNSEPDKSSLVYTDPIAIDTTTVIRAKVIADNYLIPRSQAQTYIITDRELTLPIISISTDNRYLWDDSIGIYCVGKNGLQYGEVIKANFIQKWRRPMLLSYFPDSNSDEVINQFGEMRIGGDGSRLYPSKSMIIYSHKRFGKKEFSYPIFQNPDKKDVIIKSMMLRNSGQDFRWTYLNDATNQLLMGGKVDLDYQAYQPAILYINGCYWGIINIRERSEEDYVYGNYNRLEDDIDVIENWYDVKVGDNIESNHLIEGVNNNQFSYEELKKMVDLSEFINFCILHMFVANRDYPANNVVMWRERKEEGKWRFIAKDTDVGGMTVFVPKDFNSLDMLINPINDEFGDKVKTSALFRVLMQSEEFKSEFIRFFTIYLGDILSPKATNLIIDSLKAQIELEMPYHINRHSGTALDFWYEPPTLDEWNSFVSQKKEWLSERIYYQYKHLNDYMGYGGLMTLKVNKPEGVFNEFVMQLNGIDLQTNQFDGMYYKGQTFKLEWKGKLFQLKNWQVTIVYANRGEPIVTVNTSPILEIAVQEQIESINIQPVVENGSNVDELKSYDLTIVKERNGIRLANLYIKGQIDVFDLSGRNIYSGQAFNDYVFIPLADKGTYIIQIYNEKERVTQKVIF